VCRNAWPKSRTASATKRHARTADDRTGTAARTGQPRSGQRLVGRWIAAKVAGDSGTFDDGKGLYVEHLGLKVVNPVWHPATGDKPGRWGIVHAARGAGLSGRGRAASGARCDLRGTRWQGGGWKQTLARVPGPSKWRRSALPGRRSARCWCRCTPSLILMSCHR
jgi:hypothetical protein